MPKILLPFAFVTFAAFATATPTTPCTAGTLTSYQASYIFSAAAPGCSIGILDYSNFSYHNVSNAPTEASILLTPTSQGFGFSLVSGLPFTASAGQIVKFEIDYNILIDPAPILTGADNSLDPPTGNVSIVEYFCNDSQYVFTATCFGGSGIQTLSVGTIPPLTLSSSIVFTTPATTFQEVGVVFTLDGTNGASTFDSLDTDTTVVGAVPEPAASFLVGLALVAGSYTLRKRKR